MFTGLIQTLGQVQLLERRGDSARLKISTSLVKEDLQLGESIAVNGVCLTLTNWDQQGFSADVSPESLSASTLGSLRPQMPVNLERALRLCDRLGGHLVSGHIDCVAEVRRRYREQNAERFELSLPEEARPYLINKGSVAIDGVSLTVNQVTADGFSVAVIPHTLAETTLQSRREGDLVNIETDLIGRYVERLLNKDKSDGGSAGLSLELLAKNGFL